MNPKVQVPTGLYLAPAQMPAAGQVPKFQRDPPGWPVGILSAVTLIFVFAQFGLVRIQAGNFLSSAKLAS